MLCHTLGKRLSLVLICLLRHHQVMINIKPRRLTTRDNFSHSRALIEVLANVRDEVSMKISAEALFIDVMIVALAEATSISLGLGMTNFGVDLVSGVFAISVSHGRDGRAGVTIEVLTGTTISVASFDGKNVSAGVDSNMLAATTTAFVSVPMLTSSEDALAFGSGASSCWPATT